MLFIYGRIVRLCINNILYDKRNEELHKSSLLQSFKLGERRAPPVVDLTIVVSEITGHPVASRTRVRHTHFRDIVKLADFLAQ